jgi:hypothetical protein
MKFKDIKKFPQSYYSCDVGLDHLIGHLDCWKTRIVGGKELRDGLVLQPSFQRGYVWTSSQQSSYVEYLIRGGRSGRDVYFNNPTWDSSYRQPTECLDGQQRIGACLAFLNGEIKCFGHFIGEFEDHRHLTNASLRFHVFKIKDRKELVETYIQMNTGGSVHTEEDLSPAYEELRLLEIADSYGK